MLNQKTLNELVTEFFSYLDLVEESDNGNLFHPVTIGCCRNMIIPKLENCLKEMKKIIKEENE